MAATQTHSETKRRTSTRKAAPDAIKLLKDDHRQVEEWFEAFEKTNSGSKKQKLADDICLALKVHTQIEEEIFYPACREAGLEEDLMDEADVEHDGAKKLIAEIEAGKPGDDHWDAKVKVLSEMIKHHVKEEEQRDGMFAKAKKKADLDLDALGEEMQARKADLMKQKKNGG
ncbi:hemerythrin domain-containing protein [Terricaulis silvestris]|uniref:DNA nickase n=1 Tax=Terricaulis silvestris TaxID=2686094 RepID=A0A6I6MTL7_9CAUL|nr:hemerythrin domain-containing protein [Terricaulis silvestris]QGZ96117.1 DNA nickase [Terricaulis silvestris]